MNAPIVFCHYGNSGYLPFVFESAAISNPDKAVVLLGDDSNRWLGGMKGVEHHRFDDFEDGEEIETFNRVYQLVQGKSHRNVKGGRDWVNFVFKRWFYVYNFLRSRGYEDFWHFDSDNMLVDSLASHEPNFAGYDCTEQCNGACLNGYISSLAVVRGYLDTINRLFQDEEYLDGIKRKFQDESPGHAFTEMLAYHAHRDSVKSIRLNTVIDGTTFDDCICQDHGMLTEEFPTGREIKRVGCDGNGKFYCYPKDGSPTVRLNSINLSWVPQTLFAVVLDQLKSGTGNGDSTSRDLRTLPTLCELYRQQFRLKTFLMRTKVNVRRLTRPAKA